jgi:magnesium transporter
MLPFLLRLTRRDPQIASGPVALAIADMLTLILYFNLGRWLLA